MHHPKLKSILFFISLFLLVSIACRTSGQVDPTATMELVVEPEPTVEIIVEPEPTVEVVEPDPEQVPTDTLEPTLPPTEVPVVEEPTATVASNYYIEEFGFDPNWYFLVVSPRGSDPNAASYKFERNRMIFSITERQLYAYYINTQHTYEDIRLDINLENRGVNSQQVSLICQMSDEGWYEWAVQSDGLWRLYFVKDDGTFIEYDQIASGGSKYVRTGREVNEYTLFCEGNKLSFFINDVEPTGSPHVDRKYALRWGEVGFSVSSLEATPVTVEIDWFAVTPP